MTGFRRVYVTLCLLLAFSIAVCQHSTEETAENYGPDEWWRIDPAFRMCQLGSHQSPISIKSPSHVLRAVSAKKENAPYDPDGEEQRQVNDSGLTCPLTLYAPTLIHLVYDGQLLEFLVEKGSTLKYDSETYMLDRIVFHAPAEHTFEGEAAEETGDMELAGELQFFHYGVDESENLLALSVPLRVRAGGMASLSNNFAEGNQELEQLVKHFPNANSIEDVLADGELFNPAALLPDNDANFYQYDGSLTQPPCTEGIKWLVMTHGIEVSSDQIDKIKMNPDSVTSRPLQDQQSRIVLKSRFTMNECTALKDDEGYKYKGETARQCTIGYDDCYNGCPDRKDCRCKNCNSHPEGLMRWKGKYCERCALKPDDCANGSLNFEACECEESQGIWRGITKDECIPVSCMNGGLPPDDTSTDCMCQCVAGWGGRLCNVCMTNPRECGEGGTLDRNTCTCKCDSHLSGNRCELCELTRCPNGGKVVVSDTECRCEGCMYPYTGRFCKECSLEASDCKNGGHLDSERCSCNCETIETRGRWVGPTCEICSLLDSDCEKYEKRGFGQRDDDQRKTNPNTVERGKCECVHATEKFVCGLDKQSRSGVVGNLIQTGELDANSGLCRCHIGWTGVRCDLCVLTEMDCQNGCILNYDTCMCDGGTTIPWKQNESMARCTECSRDEEDCQNGGTLDKETCTCKCPKGRGGENCEECRNEECGINASSSSGADCCECDHPWEDRGYLSGQLAPSGQLICTKCSLEACDCLGNRPNLSTCTCDECGSPDDYFHWDSTEKECVCIEDPPPDTCQHESVWDKASCKCQCKYGEMDAKCSCCPPRDCPKGKVQDQDTCHCKCENSEDAECTEDPLICIHGMPYRSQGICQCDPGWSGDQCEMCHLDCKNGGEVNQHNTCSCNCPHDWTGPQCDQEVSEDANSAEQESMCLQRSDNWWCGSWCELCNTAYGGCPDFHILTLVRGKCICRLDKYQLSDSSVVAGKLRNLPLVCPPVFENDINTRTSECGGNGVLVRDKECECNLGWQHGGSSASTGCTNFVPNYCLNTLRKDIAVPPTPTFVMRLETTVNQSVVRVFTRQLDGIKMSQVVITIDDESFFSTSLDVPEDEPEPIYECCDGLDQCKRVKTAKCVHNDIVVVPESPSGSAGSDRILWLIYAGYKTMPSVENQACPECSFYGNIDLVTTPTEQFLSTTFSLNMVYKDKSKVKGLCTNPKFQPPADQKLPTHNQGWSKSLMTRDHVEMKDSTPTCINKIQTMLHSYVTGWNVDAGWIPATPSGHSPAVESKLTEACDLGNTESPECKRDAARSDASRRLIIDPATGYCQFHLICMLEVCEVDDWVSGENNGTGGMGANARALWESSTKFDDRMQRYVVGNPACLSDG